MKTIKLVNNRTSNEYEYNAKENHELLYDIDSRSGVVCLYEREINKVRQPIAAFSEHSIYYME